MSGWANFANFGNSAIQGFNNYENILAQRQQRELQANAARAYGEAMMKMSQPQPWRVPMANDYTPPPPAMTMPNFMQAMPKGIDPAAAGMAATQFAPMARNAQMDEYRDQQIKLGQERNQQGAQRIQLSEQRIAARDQQNEVANKFRDRALQLQQLGIEQRNPTVWREWTRVENGFKAANNKVDQLVRELNNSDRSLAMGLRRDLYDARQMELAAMLKAAQAELAAADQARESFDMSGQGLPQPGSAPPAQPAIPSGGAPYLAPSPAPAPPAAPPAAPPTFGNIPPAAVDDLRKNPTPKMLEFFEKQFRLKPGSAKRYLQGPQSGMPVVPGPQGGPEILPVGAKQPATVPQGKIQRTSTGQPFVYGPRGEMLQVGSDGRLQYDVETGAPLRVLTGMSGADKRAIALTPAADPINQRVAERERLVAAARQSMGEPSVYERPGALYPTEGGGMAPNQPELDASSGFAMAPGQQPAPAKPRKDFFEDDRLERALSDSVMSEAGAMKDLAGAAGAFVSDVRKNYGKAAGVKPSNRGPAASPGNPYVGMTLPQLIEAQKRLAARDFAARTPEEKAAVKREMDYLYEASGVAAARGQRGS